MCLKSATGGVSVAVQLFVRQRCGRTSDSKTLGTTAVKHKRGT